MQYALNHPWKFELPVLAFFTGFMQIFVLLIIEFVNYVLVVGSESYKDIVLSVLALYFVVNFSHFLYNQPYTGIEFKRIISCRDGRYDGFLRK